MAHSGHQVELQRLNRLYAALSQINQAIVRSGSAAELLGQVCRVLVEAGGFGMAWIGRHDAATHRIVPVAHFGDVNDYLSHINIYGDDRPEGRGPTGTAFREARPYICNDMLADPATLPWRAEYERRGLRASAALPIRLHENLWGALTVYAYEAELFQDREIALLLEAAADISFALAHFEGAALRVHAEAALRDYATRLRAMSRKLLEVQEAERRSLSRDLHDTVAQELAALGLNLASLRAALPVELDASIGRRLEDAQGLLEETSRHVRDVLTALRPQGIDELGLLAALRDHLQRLARRHALRTTVTGSEPVPRLAPEHAIALFRIAQEALNNAVKHAGASELRLDLHPQPGCVQLTIADDGRGFDPGRHSASNGGGLGMTTMRERAETVGAQLDIESASGRGTRVTVQLPRKPV